MWKEPGLEVRSLVRGPVSHRLAQGFRHVSSLVGIGAGLGKSSSAGTAGVGRRGLHAAQGTKLALRVPPAHGGERLNYLSQS